MTRQNVLAVDPGSSLAGVALFHQGVLEKAALIRPNPAHPYLVAAGVERWWLTIQAKDYGEPLQLHVLAVEGQQIYRHSKGDPNDLLGLAYCAGAVHARIHADQRKSILPRSWTGGVPKEARVQKTLRALTPAELDLVMTLKVPKSLLHNVIDAVGIGLYTLGRGPTSTKGVIQ